ncbi:MAG: hypothetical protein ACFB13_06015 [Kiloniellaceae bacterium]
MPEDTNQETVADVVQTSEVLGKIAGDETAFRLLVQSFRAQDHEGYRDLLARFEALPRCHLICEWLCSKHCALVCLELAGLPPKDAPVLDLRDFGELIVKVSSDEKTLERLVGAVCERDENTFRAIVEKLGLQRYAHYICYWICSIRCRLICDILCSPEKPVYIIGCNHLMPVVLQAAAAIRRLLADKATLAAVEKGVLARDCDGVRIVLQRAGFQGLCHWICHWVCVWRCVRICFRFCRPFPLTAIEDELPEIRAFAQAVAKLAKDPKAVARLVAAVDAEDADSYAALVKELGLTKFCHQLCHWLCGLWCRRFCWCVCPPPKPRPWFTHVGHFHIYGDIDSTNGLTNKSVLGHGGPGYGFFSCLELRGFCPAESPDAAGVPMRYRFLYERSGSQTALVGDLLCPVIVGSRTIYWDVNGTGLEETFQTVMIAGSGATVDPTPPPALPPGTPWGPPPTHVIVPDADGWITVDPAALGAGFNGALIGFNSNTAFPGGNPAPGVAAGTQVPAANLKNGVAVAVIFEATRVGGPTSPPDYTNTLSRIHINNWNEVALLDLLQFHSGGGNACSPLSSDLDIEYTADHELMAAWSISITTAASIPPLSLPAGTATRSGGANTAFGTHHEDISAWPSCSYTVRLTTRRALTNGLVDDDADQVTKTFCIGGRGRSG